MRSAAVVILAVGSLAISNTAIAGSGFDDAIGRFAKEIFNGTSSEAPKSKRETLQSSTDSGVNSDEVYSLGPACDAIRGGNLTGVWLKESVWERYRQQGLTQADVPWRVELPAEPGSRTRVYNLVFARGVPGLSIEHGERCDALIESLDEVLRRFQQKHASLEAWEEYLKRPRTQLETLLNSTFKLDLVRSETLDQDNPDQGFYFVQTSSTPPVRDALHVKPG
jgi:hypothetical protein